MLRPAGPRVLVRPEKLEEADPVYRNAARAGIVTPEFGEKIRERQAMTKATVVAIGSTCWQAPVGDGTPWCKIGDVVYYAKYSGHVPVDETLKDYLLLNDEDILGVLEND